MTPPGSQGGGDPVRTSFSTSCLAVLTPRPAASPCNTRSFDKYLLCARPLSESRPRRTEQEPWIPAWSLSWGTGAQAWQVLLPFRHSRFLPHAGPSPGLQGRLCSLGGNERWGWEAASSRPGAQGGPGGRALGRVHFLAPLFAACPWLLVLVSAPPTASLDEWAAGRGLEFPLILRVSGLSAGSSPRSPRDPAETLTPPPAV